MLCGLTSFEMFGIMKETTTKSLGLEKYPDWYDQKSKHKDDLWFKSSPSQTTAGNLQAFGQVMEIFYRLKESGGIESGNTKRYKKDKMPIPPICKMVFNMKTAL